MYWRSMLTGVLSPLLILAVFSSSTTYGIKSYDLGTGGASNSGTSSTYAGESTVGEIGGTTSSATYEGLASSIQAQQANVPAAPTLSNNGNTYYNELGCILNVGSNPSDYTYAIAVSSNSFVSTSYVQATGALGSSPVYQTYTLWGGSSGTLITGLTPSTTYEVKVAALQGKFSNSAYGPYASIATVATSLSFSLSPNTENLGNLTAGSVITSPSNVTVSLTTNADYGGNVYLAGTNGGLKSATTGYLIATGSFSLAAQTEGFGVQGVSATQTSGGPLVIDSPYNGTSSTVGPTATTFAQIFSSANPIISGSGTASILAKASTTTPAATNYQETITFVAAASF